MAALILPSRRFAQPQGAVEVDWGNPLTRGLTNILLPSVGTLDTASRKSFTVSAARVISERGIVFHGVNGQSAVLPNVVNNKVPFTCAFLTRGMFELRCQQLYQSGLIWNSGFSARARIWDAGSATQKDIVLGGLSHTPWYAITITATNERVVSLYVNGVFVGSQTIGAFASDPLPEFGVVFHDGTTSGQCVLGVKTDSTWTPSQVRSWAENPWQIFRPVPRRLYFDLGAGGPATYNDSFTEALTAADSYATSAIFGNAFSESVTAGDSDAGSLSIAQSIAEALAAADSILATTTFTDTHSAGLTAADSLASIQTILETVAESVAAGYSQTDSLTGGSGTTYNETHSASVTASFTAISVQTFVDALSEALTVAATYTSSAIYQAALTEAVSALDAFSVSDGSTTLTAADLAAIDALIVARINDIAAAVLAAAQATPIHADARAIRGLPLAGNGVPGDEFRV